MNNQEQHRRFDADLSALLDGREDTVDHNGAYSDLLAVGRTLAAAELGAAAHKEAVRSRITQGSATRRSARGHGGRKVAGSVAAAAAFALLIGVWFTPSSFASGVLNRIISTVSLGHITVFQVDPPSEEASSPLPEALQGKVFTKDGKPVYELNAHTGPLYTADGEEIAGFADMEIVTKAQAEAEVREGIRTLTDPDTLSRYTNFQVKLPGYLPEGYAFSRAEQYLDEQGEASPKYLSLYFANGDTGKEIYIQQRYGDEETAYESSTDGTLEKAKVRGADAVIANGNSIAWEADGVLYDLVAEGMDETLDKSELIRIAESLK
ncbi:DUF4367 domain-containing protein [Paenibacillus macerans]|uniref:DUF4367 domain-containing protein n=1 Tax=Paenibacillus macerans TaxID=44252 RepID=UPI003D31B63B